MFKTLVYMCIKFFAMATEWQDWIRHQDTAWKVGCENQAIRKYIRGLR